MRRKITQRLEEWLKADRRTCPVIVGARQIGKTYAVEEFGKRRFRNFIRIDFVTNEKAKEAFDGDLDVETVVRELSARFPSMRFVPGETLIFLDEIQECPRARSALKPFATDGDYKVIASGSLLGLSNMTAPSIPVGYEEQMRMGPMDFEEFLWALGFDERLMDHIREKIRAVEPFEEPFFKTMMEYLRWFMAVGGMPEAVREFSLHRKFDGVRSIQRKIVNAYMDDIQHHTDRRFASRVRSCFEAIPSMLARENKKFMYSKVEDDIGYKVGLDYYGYALDWLRVADLALFCENLRQIKEPLSENRKPEAFKVYLRDTGLLTSMYDDNLIERIIKGDLDVNKGALTENLVADMLDLQDRKLMYFGNRSEDIEVDFVTGFREHPAVLEVKSGDRPRSKSLNKLSSDPDIECIMFETRNTFVDERGVKHFPLFAAAFMDCIDPREALEADLMSPEELLRTISEGREPKPLQ